MSKPKQKTQSRQQRPAKPRRGRRFFVAVMVMVAIGIVAAVALLRAERGGFDNLNGRWFRTDGGYVLEIRSVDSSGKIDAAYFNPKSINVAKAEASRDGSTVKVF